MESSPAVLVYPDPATLALATATFIVAEARRKVKETGRFMLALAGGSTPRDAYTLLARSPFVDLVPWKAVHVFWGDERCVDTRDPRSNEGMARECLLDHVPIPDAQIHPMRCGRGALDPDLTGGPASEAAARRVAEAYEELLRGFFPAAAGNGGGGGRDRGQGADIALDVVMLGLGDDGHTASLFPGSAVLGEVDRWTALVPPVEAPDRTPVSHGGEPYRVTLTAPFINRSGVVLFLASGRAKAKMVRAVLESPAGIGRLPAQLIRPATGKLVWHLDDEAAALLTIRSKRS